MLSILFCVNLCALNVGQNPACVSSVLLIKSPSPCRPFYFQISLVLPIACLLVGFLHAFAVLGLMLLFFTCCSTSHSLCRCHRTYMVVIATPPPQVLFLAFSFPAILAHDFAPLRAPECSEILFLDSLCTHLIDFWPSKRGVEAGYEAPHLRSFLRILQIDSPPSRFSMHLCIRPSGWACVIMSPLLCCGLLSYRKCLLIIRGRRYHLP